MKAKCRGAAGVVLAGALLCGTTACQSDGGGDGRPEARSTPSRSASADAGPDHAAQTAVNKAVERSEEINSVTYRMTGEMPGRQRIEMDAKFSRKPLAMSMIQRFPDQPGQRMEVRLTGGVMYIGGAFAEAAGKGKKWIKLDMSKPAEKGGGFEGLSGQGGDSDPSDQINFLSGSKDLKRLGEETVDGRRTAHYAGTITLRQMRDSLKGKDPAVKARKLKSLERFEKLGIDRMTMDIWIGEDDRTTQFRARADTDSGKMDMLTKFLEVNKAVTVEAPPASDVYDPATEAGRGA
ncbi:DUF1396 domain-containing protein [Streptomyces sp. NPDC049837]|uniref:DUF1396 domain-containing protein n=1 Tax=Streptomyces sp. NPDC049837 TaxID=3155277 RepID=UPI0034261A1E